MKSESFLKGKQFLLNNLMMILYAVSILALLFTFCTVKTTATIDSEWVSDVSSTATAPLSGFTVATGSGVVGFLLILCPALLACLNYIKPLQKYKSILAIAVPVVCIAASIYLLITAKGISAVSAKLGSDVMSGAGASLDCSTSAGFGFVLVLLANLAIAVFGVLSYMGLKGNLPASVEAAASAVGIPTQPVAAPSPAPAVTQPVAAPSPAPAVTQPVAAPMPSPAAAAGSAAANETSFTDAVGQRLERMMAPRPTRKNAEETLQLIERLAKMRDQGILTDEEFQDKKTQLLAEI